MAYQVSQLKSNNDENPLSHHHPSRENSERSKNSQDPQRLSLANGRLTNYANW
jgi:hypothetical protein